MKDLLRIVSSTALVFFAAQAQAYKMPGYFVFEVGPYWASEGEGQDIDIVSLIGDHYSADTNNQVGGVLGAGYLFHGLQSRTIDIDYGVNVFYLTKTQVEGDITQEHLFTNLSYEYSISHVPVYALAKAFYKPYENVGVTFDLGLGANFLMTSGYKDKPITDIALSDHAYLDSTETTTVFSAMAGVGIKGIVNKVPLELGYRFFYLGEGFLEPRTNQILDDLSTGNVYVNALMLTISI